MWVVCVAYENLSMKVEEHPMSRLCLVCVTNGSQ
jgi:hypothetical protein